MRIHVLSDLHTEFAPFEPPPVNADVVVLAGDIGLKLHGLDWARSTFPTTPVIYVPGNHEYYGNSVPHLTDKLRQRAEGSNVHVLDRDAVVIDGVRFLGATLWTDFCIFGAEKRDRIGEVARASMTDFKRIRMSPGYGKLTPKGVWLLHHQARGWLARHLYEPCNLPTVVVTHHAPMLEGVAPHYREDPLTGAYASDLRPFLNDGGAALWIFGHTHYAVDTVVGKTRVVSNQRGYPDEPALGFDPGLVVEVAS